MAARRGEAAGVEVEGLDGVLSQAFPLRAIPELPLLLVREEGDVIVLLRMALRIISLLARVAATPLLAGNNEWLVCVLLS